MGSRPLVDIRNELARERQKLAGFVTGDLADLGPALKALVEAQKATIKAVIELIDRLR